MYVKRKAVSPIETDLPFKKEEIEGSIQERFEQVVRTYPDRIAVKTRTAEMTYHELDRLSNRIANAILSEYDSQTVPIALLLDKGVTPLAMILGTLKSGKPYVTIEPAWPHTRIANILTDVQIRLLITNQSMYTFATELVRNKTQVLTMEDIEARFSSEHINISTSPDSPAVILYTSGSTGTPKGIFRAHRHILHSVWHRTSTNQILVDDRQTFFSSYSFAASLAPTFSTILTGARLSPYSVSEEGISQLAHWLIQERITIVHFPIMLFRQFAQTLTPSHHFPKLRLLRLGGGQALYKHDVALFKQYFPDTRLLIHGFSTTESGRVAEICIDQQTEISSPVIPAGYAVEDKEISLLDETGQQVGFNTVGEIAVKSRYLSPGYWNDPDLTRQKFLSDPEGGDKRIYLTGDLGRMRPDGCLEYLGRKDFQVKIRGYRVVLTEIETALYHLEAVKEAVVVAREHKPGEADLIAYVVPAQHLAPTISELRRDLVNILPEYMVPVRFVFLDTLPLTATGKVDRQNLPEPDWKRPELDTAFVAPRDELERKIAVVCEKIMGIHPIGVKDDVFDLGMHSLQVLRLLLELEKGVGIRIAPTAFSQCRTIAHIAQLIEEISQRPRVTPGSESGSSNRTASSPLPAMPARTLTLLEQLLNLKLGEWRFPYSLGIILLSWACGTQWGQHRYLRQGNLAPIRQFLPLLGNTDHPDRVLRQHALVNTKSGQEWYLAALMRSSPHQFNRWVTVTGLDVLQECRRQGRGIIFSGGHFGPKRLIGIVFDRLDLTQVLHLANLLPPSSARAARRRQRTRAYKRHHTLSLAPSERLSSLYTAAQVLTNQGMVYMTPDGRGGERGVMMPFLGRQRVFRTGFAELALISNAIVLPVLSAMTVQGRMMVEFLNPLETGTTDQSDQGRVESLIQQYAKLLEQRWRDNPANIHAEQIHGFLKLPSINST